MKRVGIYSPSFEEGVREAQGSCIDIEKVILNEGIVRGRPSTFYLLLSTFYFLQILAAGTQRVPFCAKLSQRSNIPFFMFLIV